MTPEEIYGDNAKFIVIDELDDCWLWLGEVRLIGGKHVPAVQGTNRHYRNVMLDALVQAKVIPNTRTSYYRACAYELCVNPDHYTGPGTDVQRMITIRGLSTEQGSCLIWEHSESAEGLPMLYTRNEDGTKTSLSIQRFVYEMEHGVKLPSDTAVYTTCHSRKCVSFRHVAVKAPVARPYVTTAGNGKQARVAEARREHARMFIEEQNKKMIEEYR